MELNVKKSDKEYQVTEDGRVVYTVKIEESDRSTKIVLYNAYEVPVMTLSCTKKWYSKVFNSKKQIFTFIVNDQEAGFLKASKKGYEACYYDVIYRFLGGKENGTFCVRGYDREHPEMHLMLYEEAKLKFRNTAMQGFYILISVYMKAFGQLQHFDHTAFDSVAKNVYQDTYVYVQK